MKFFFDQILKVSVFYLEKQKSFIPNFFFLAVVNIKTKKSLFTDPIFSERFAYSYERVDIFPLESSNPQRSWDVAVFLGSSQLVLKFNSSSQFIRGIIVASSSLGRRKV